MTHKTLKILPLFFLVSILFGFSYGSVFFIESAESRARFYLWNSTTFEYSAWLDYTNPYGFICDDLRYCYIDDTNTGTIDDNFIIDNFFDGNPNIVPVLQNFTEKRTTYFFGVDYADHYQLLAFYNDTTTNKISVVQQLGSVWTVYEDMDFTGLESNFFNYSAVGAGTYPIRNDSYYSLVTIDISGTENREFISGMLYSDEAVVLLLEDVIPYSSGISQFNTMIINYYEVGSGGNKGSAGMIFAGNSIGAYADNTNYYDFTSIPLAYYIYPAGMFTGLKNYHGMYYSPNTYVIGMFLHPSRIPDSNYRSVDFPSCDDIATGNEETDIYFNSTSSTWIRQCEGVVPTPETYTCDLECIVPSYPIETKNCTLSQSFFLAGDKDMVAWSHINQPTIPDGFPYCFVSGTNTATIEEMRLYTSLNITFINSNESWGLYAYSTTDDINPYGFGYNDEDYLVKKQCSLGSSGNVYMILGDVNSALNYIVLPSESWNTAYKDQQQNNILSHYYKWYYNPASPESFCPDLDIPVSISAIYAGLLPYTSSGSTNVWAEYDNRTSSIPNGCAEYESFCYPDVPDGYVYDEDDIVCVGASCYVEAGEECNNNGVCDTPFETQASCPADCVVPTPEEISDIIDNTLEDIGEMIGTDATGMKFIIWVVISLIVSVGLTILIASAGGSSGAGVAFLITMILFMLIGSVIAWIPMWIGIVFVIIAGFILSFVLKGIFATG